MRHWIRKVYRTLSEPRFLTGALVTAYAVLAVLGVTMFIEYSSGWVFRIAFGTLILGSLIAMSSAWCGGREWEPVGLWLLIGALAGTITLEFGPKTGPLQSISIAALILMLIFTISRMYVLKHRLNLKVAHVRYDYQ